MIVNSNIKVGFWLGFVFSFVLIFVIDYVSRNEGTNVVIAVKELYEKVRGWLKPSPNYNPINQFELLKDFLKSMAIVKGESYRIKIEEYASMGGIWYIYNSTNAREILTILVNVNDEIELRQLTKLFVENLAKNLRFQGVETPILTKIDNENSSIFNRSISLQYGIREQQIEWIRKYIANSNQEELERISGEISNQIIDHELEKEIQYVRRTLENGI